MERLGDRPYWKISFDEAGALTAPTAPEFLDEVSSAGVRDLFVISHGWNTGQKGADSLYETLLPMIGAAAEPVSSIGPIGFVGIYWPALWFPDRPATKAAPGGPVGAALASSSGPVGGERQASGDAELSGHEIAKVLRESFDDQERRRAVERLGELIDEGSAAAVAGSEPESAQQERLEEFHQVLQRLVPVSTQPTFEDSGETALLFTGDPRKDYALIAEEFGSAPPGGSAQDLGDGFSWVWNGAKSTLRIFSYYTMKARAGDVGRLGLGPLLQQLHATADPTRVHLIGHSFGARLISFALAGIESAEVSPLASLVLVQAAFSHWSFSEARDNPFGSAGALRGVVDRVHGPLIATYSEHDWAVGRWYPRASALARQDSHDDAHRSRWGGLGSDGFQAVAPLEDRELLRPGSHYRLTGRHFYRVDGSSVIDDWRQSAFAGAHSDIRRPEVAWLAVAAAAAAN